MKRVIIIGAGPAGLTAAYELVTRADDMEVIVLEESGMMGGISRTVCHNGNRMDMGGHRFFSKMPRVNAWWEKMMPMQGAPAWDDILLERDVPLAQDGPDPQQEDGVMLSRTRVSRIYFDGKFYDYPISLKPETFINMGLVKTAKVGLSYLAALVHKLPEDNLENFYINRFGRQLYEMFFETYTANLWGRHPREIDASWGAQRVKGVSITAVLKDVASRALHLKNAKQETSLIDRFKYPKLGPGQLWEITAQRVKEAGGTIVTNARVVALHRGEDGRIDAVTYEGEDGAHTLEADIVISSMPVRDLVAGMNGVPADMRRIADGLPYRDYMTLGVLVNRLKICNRTKMKTVGGIVPDCWVYVQDRSVRMGRLQIYNNWSPYMVADCANTVWVGLEYFVSEGDDLWRMSEEAFARVGIGEMIKIGLIDSADDVLDCHMERVKKAYPAYFDTYGEMDKLIGYLNTIDNLYCVGRNGQHRYNNIDHSMCTSFEAVDNILTGRVNRDNIWNVNTESEYHEQKADGRKG